MKDKLITEDIKKLVKSACLDNPNIVKYELENYNRFNVGCIDIIIIKGQKPVLHIGEGHTSEYNKIWNKDVGHVLTKELYKEDPLLFVLETTTFKALLKEIRDNEIDDFKEKGFDHITIGDKHYTIIKVVSSKRSFVDKTGDYDFDEDLIIENRNQNITTIDDDFSDDEEDEDNNSYALF